MFPNGCKKTVSIKMAACYETNRLAYAIFYPQCFC